MAESEPLSPDDSAELPAPQSSPTAENDLAAPAPTPASPSQASPPAARPVESIERYSSVDMLRGVALLGILLMNIQMFGLPHLAYENPLAWGGATGWNLYYWVANQIFFEGKMRFLFSLLFGAGTALLTARAEDRGAGIATADIYLRRCLWLALFGLIHAYFIWEGDILYHYGLVGLGLFVFRVLRPKTLIITAACIWLLTGVMPSAGLMFSLEEQKKEAYQALKVAEAKRTKKQKEAIESYQKTLEAEDIVKRREKVDEELTQRRGSWADAFAFRAPEAFRMQTVFMLKFGIGDVLFPMLLGIAFIKMGILTAQKPTGFYFAWSAVGYGLGIPVLTYITQLVVASGWDPWTRPLLLATYEYGRLTVGGGHLMLLLAIYRLGWFRPATGALARVGQMAFTNYILTSLLMTTFFNGYGLGYVGKLERHQLLFVVAGMWSINLILSPIWLRYFRFGPLEWAWRSLTYWKRQPFRRESTASTSLSAGSPSPA